MVLDLKKKMPSADFAAPIYGLHGEYTLASGVCVPYLNTSLEVERVVNELRAFDQVPPSLDTVWSLEELYQRDIDYDRIERQIVNGYLKDPSKLKFFNALTFVLFPRNQDGTLAADFTRYEGDDPVIPVPGNAFDESFSEPESRAAMGGVQYARASILGRLRWDRDRVVAVAVDGQHRLTALRKWYESKERVLQQDEKRTTIPVIFLLLHGSIGFSMPATAGRTLRSIAREVFTDLNKNAKKVDEAREIILDDRSLTALCARRLVTSETCKDSDEQLPLSLVRWQEANNRFDQSFFINSLLHLHQIVESVLDLKIPADPLEFGQVTKYIETIEESLGGSDRQLKELGVSLSAHYKENYVANDEEAFRPFLHLPESYLRLAVDQFSTIHRPYIIRALTGFQPYREHLAYCRANGLLSGFFGKYYAQPEAHRQQIAQTEERDNANWYKEKIAKHVTAIEKIKGTGDSDSWCFKTIFQKALIRVVKLVAFTWGNDAERLGTVDDVLEVFDKLYESGFFRLKAEIPGHDYLLWTFIGIHHSTQQIKVNKRVENYITSVLLLAYYVNRKYVYDSSVGDQTVTSPRDLVRYFSHETSGSDRPPMLWPQCVASAYNLLTLFANESKTWVKLPPDAKRAKQKQDKEARLRLEAIIERAIVTFKPSVNTSQDSVDDDEGERPADAG